MNVYEKIAAIYRDVQYLAKDDNVKFGQTAYKALSEEKVTTILRSKMVEQGLIVFPVEMFSLRQGNISHVDVKYRIVNVENPDDYIEVVSCGDGSDTQDKGAGKAMTYAYKYMWLRTFAIPTGEDPDKIASAQIDAEEAERAQKAVEDAKKGNYTCSVCGKPIVEWNGRTPQHLVQFSEKEYHCKMCGDCLRAKVKGK